MTTRLSAIAFTSDIARLTENFRGRQWVFDDIDRWLKKSEERFFILTGEPGVGKSAIAARLTQIRDDIAAYHFCRAGDVETVRPARILRSLAAQLGEHLTDYGQALANTIKPVHLRIEVNITIGSMTGSQVTGVYIENLKESDPENELDILIRAPLEELQKMYAERQQAQPTLAIILIDSLDEAVTTTGTTLVKLLTQLSKSTSLPSWVRFVMTSRRERRVLRGFEPLKPYHLQEKSDESLADVRRYVEDRVDQPALQDRLQASQIQPQTLINEITNLSHGNFLYTTLLLNDIEAGRQALDNLAALPKSIDDIYHGFLSRFSEEDWSERYKPIFGVLTVAQEPISEKQISNFTRIDPEDVRDSIRIARQFFDVEVDEENKETYSIFHQSLRDYLLDEERNSDFWCNERKQHQRIIDFCERKSKSWQQLQEIERYGLQYLAHHLKQAGQEEQLYNLLTGSSSWMNAKFAAFSNDEAYVADLELALGNTANPLTPHEIVRLAQIHTVKQVVYHRASRNNDADLKTLVWLGSGAEAIHLAHRRSNDVQKFIGLLVIHNTLQQKGQPPNAILLKEMWESAQAIEISTERTKALRELATVLGQIGHRPEVNIIFTETIESLQAKSEQTLEEAVALTAESVGNTKEGNSLFEGLQELAFVLILLGQLVEAEKVIQKLESIFPKRGALISLYSQLSIALAHAAQFDEAERVARTINDSEVQADTFKHLTINLAQAKKFAQAERIIQNIVFPAIQAQALRHLAAAFSQAGQQNVAVATLREAKKTVQAIEDDVDRSEMLSELAVALLQVGQLSDAMQTFTDSKEIALSIKDHKRQAEALGKLSVALADVKYFAEAEQVARTIEDYWKQAEILRQLGTRLMQAGQESKALVTFTNAREINRVAETNHDRPKTLRQMALAFAQTGQLIDAEQTAQFIDSTESRALVLKEIAVMLMQTGNQDEAMKFIQNAKEAAYMSKSDTALRSLVPALVQLEEFTEAEQVAQAINFNASRMAALREIVTALAKLGQFTEAEQIVSSMETSGHQSIALRELASAKQHIEVEQEVHLLDSSKTLVAAMSQVDDAIARSNCRVEASKMFDEAEQFVQLLNRSKGQVEALKKLKGTLIHLAQSGYVLEAERVARSIENEQQRSKALIHLATAVALTTNLKSAFNIVGLLDMTMVRTGLGSYDAVGTEV